MAHVIFGVKLNIPNDRFVETFTHLVDRRYKKDVEEDPKEFFGDLSVPVKLIDGYELWQINNSEDSSTFLVFKRYSLLEDREWTKIIRPSGLQIHNFEAWVKDHGINGQWAEYLVLDDRR